MGRMHVAVKLLAAAAVLLAAVAALAHARVNQNGLLRTYFDQRLDRNHDGVLTIDELAATIAELDADDADSESAATIAGRADVRLLLRTADANGDGQVTWDEFGERFAYMDDNERYSSAAVPEQVRIYLGNAPTDMVIVWTTFESSAVSRVEYGLAPGVYTAAVDGFEYTYDAGVFGWDGFMHKARLFGLQTFTRYYYRVGDGATWSPEFSFRTAPAAGQRTAEPIRHLVTGDMGTFMPFGLFVADEMAQINSVNPYDMLIHMGDVAYGGTSGSPDGYEWQFVWDFWGRQVEPIGANLPYMVSVGNHEFFYNATSFNARFEFPSASTGATQNYYYSFDYGLVHYVSFCVESYLAPWAVGSPQHDWIRADLARAAANRANVPWIIVSGHRPFYGSSNSGSWEGQRLAVEPLLDEFDVDFYFAGHVHVYERSHGLMNYTITDLPDADGNYRNLQSPLHITVGTCGALINNRWEEQPTWSAFRTRSYGFSEMIVYNATAIQFTFRGSTVGPDFPKDESVYPPTALIDEFWVFK